MTEGTELAEFVSVEQKLRVVVFQEGDYWVAQCVEHDIGAFGKTFDDMVSHFKLAFQLELAESIARHGEPLSGIDPAPSYFEDMWERRSSDLKPVQQLQGTPHTCEMALVA